MTDYDMVQGTVILMATIAISLVLIVTSGAVFDEIDYRMYNSDTGSYPKWASMEHTLHDWFFTIIGALNFIAFVWYGKLLVKKLGYNRMQQWG